MKKPEAGAGQAAAELISKRIAELGGWRGATLARMRKLIKIADPDIVETWKWMGTPVWEHDGIVCTGESYKDKVKLTFARGAALKDPAQLFNSSLDGNVRRAIDILEGQEVDATSFKTLIRQAVDVNSTARQKPAQKPKVKSKVKSKPKAPAKAKQKSAKEKAPQKAPLKQAPAGAK